VPVSFFFAFYCNFVFIDIESLDAFLLHSIGKLANDDSDPMDFIIKYFDEFAKEKGNTFSLAIFSDEQSFPRPSKKQVLLTKIVNIVAKFIYNKLFCKWKNEQQMNVLFGDISFLAKPPLPFYVFYSLYYTRNDNRGDNDFEKKLNTISQNDWLVVDDSKKKFYESLFWKKNLCTPPLKERKYENSVSLGERQRNQVNYCEITQPAEVRRENKRKSLRTNTVSPVMKRNKTEFCTPIKVSSSSSSDE